MRNELQRHKRSDKVKWVFMGILLFLAFVMIAGLALQVFGTGKTKPSEWFKKQDSEQTEQLPAEGGENGTAQTRVKAMAATFSAENAVSVQSKVTYKLSRLGIGNAVYSNAFILVPSDICEMTQGSWCDEGHYLSVEGNDGNGYLICYGGGYDVGVYDREYVFRFSFYKNGELQFSKEILDKDLGFINVDGRYYFNLSQVFNIPNGIIDDVDLIELYLCVVELPPDPVKEGHVFVGWYYDQAFTRPYDGQPIYVNTELYAKFVVNQYTVVFDSAGGSSVPNQTVNWNTSATLVAPTRDGYVFEGWYLSNGTQYTNQPVTNDITLTAHWEIKTFTVTFYVDNEVYATKTVEYGQSLAKVTEAENLVMLSVFTESGVPSYDETGSVVVTENCTVEAQKMSKTDAIINTAKNNKWAIIGGIAGGVALIAIIAAVCGGAKRKHKR